MVYAFSELRSQVVDGLQGMGELRVYGASERQAARIAGTTRRLLRHQLHLSRLKGFSEGAVGLCANLAMWLSVVLLVPAISRGGLSRLDLPMMVLLTLAAFEAVAPLPAAFQMLGQTFNAARRIFDVVDAEPKIREPAVRAALPESPAVSINQLTFKYRSQAPPALSDISLEIPAGRKLAVVGATGAGKATLIRLLLRFWDYDEGEINLGSSPLKSFHSEDIRNLVSVISQETHLFNTSIRENIVIADTDAGERKLIEALKAAQIHDFVMSLPDGYETVVGEAGVRLSVGQRRRVAIARALLKPSPILILDEPCEGLDPETEQQVMNEVLRLAGSRTVLLITHRLAGLEAMDEVVILESGRIVDRGEHHELMQRSAFYRRSHDLLYRP